MARLALSPDGVLLLMVGEDGQALLVNLPRRVLLHYFNFKDRVDALEFSPCGRFFAAALGRVVQVWRTPGRFKSFAPFVLHRRYTGFAADVTALAWSHDSRFFAAGGKDTTVRVFMVHPVPFFRVITLTAHRDRIANVFFAHQSLDVRPNPFFFFLIAFHG